MVARQDSIHYRTDECTHSDTVMNYSISTYGTYVLCFTSRRSDGGSACKYPGTFCNPNDVAVEWVDYLMPDT
jgi:hypothetical protein